MDYCSSCRRHLNGALVCPGCGAYAPDIAPPATVSMPASRPASADGGPAAAPGGAAGRADAFGGPWFDGGLPEEAVPAGPEESAGPLPDADVDGPPPASRGRAARRRQLARWKKNKRRAAVATTIALVGGGLTLASLDRQSPARAQAASAPDDRGMGSVGGQAAADVEPEPAPPGTHASPGTGHPAHAGAAASVRHQGSLAAPRTAPSDTHPDSAAAPLPARAPAARQQAVAPVSGGTSGHDATTGTTTGTATTSGSGAGTGGTAQQPPAPAATPSSGGAADSSAQTSPSPAATSPSQLCLLVVCLG
ncbi:SCO2400 family protein [Streptomyces collinus]|uniref:SCO2400 family protein n=1 Tax=Streptomyces collinus TaxID=42684 RepID=UPI003699337E